MPERIDEPEWWRDKNTEICLFNIPVGDNAHVVTLNGREVDNKWEYALLQWWHKSPTLWLTWTGSQITDSEPNLNVKTPPA